MDRAGSFWRGRAMSWHPVRQAAELSRQRWVSLAVAGLNDVITDLAVDPDEAYRIHREAYELTGDRAQLDLALQYVRL